MGASLVDSVNLRLVVDDVNLERSSEGMEALRRRLVAAALRTIEREGIEATSLRTVAANARVSRQAPYLCFPDKRAMWAAAAAAVLRRERRLWTRALGGASSKPLDRLIAIARAHARFAERHPQLHALAWGPYVAKADLPELQQEAIESFAVLRSTVGACLGEGASIERQRECSVVAWAAVKGLVDLWTNRQIPASIERSVDELVAEAMNALVSGWTVGDRHRERLDGRRPASQALNDPGGALARFLMVASSLPSRNRAVAVGPGVHGDIPFCRRASGTLLLAAPDTSAQEPGGVRSPSLLGPSVGASPT
jgi:AcrR family transcriptional regulator